MSGDHFPDKYFPDNYFPGRYFQGGAVDANAMSASLTASGTVTGTLTYTSASVVETPAGPTGGGGAARFYRGKYRGELRRVIARASQALREAPAGRKRKRVTRRVAQVVRAAVDFTPPVLPQIVAIELAPLEVVRVQIQAIVIELQRAVDDRKRSAELRTLLDAYLKELAAVDRQEEEAIAAVLLLAA